MHGTLLVDGIFVRMCGILLVDDIFVCMCGIFVCMGAKTVSFVHVQKSNFNFNSIAINILFSHKSLSVSFEIMAIDLGLALLSSCYVLWHEICEYVDSLEFISVNHNFHMGFHYYGEDLQYVWMSILSYRANQIGFYVISVQGPVMEAIAAIEDEWTAEIE